MLFAWLAAIEAGETVRIGPFGFTKEAIALRGEVLRWDEISKMWAEDTDLGCYLKIRRKLGFLPGGEWCAERTSSFAGEANAFYFFDLLRRLAPSHLLVNDGMPAYVA